MKVYLNEIEIEDKQLSAMTLPEILSHVQAQTEDEVIFKVFVDGTEVDIEYIQNMEEPMENMEVVHLQSKKSGHTDHRDLRRT